MCQSDNGSLTSGHALRRWSERYIESMTGLKDVRAPTRLQALFSAAGFMEIQSTMLQLPLCGWSNGEPPTLTPTYLPAGTAAIWS